MVNDFSQVTGGEGVERSFWESVRKKDWKELDKHIAPNYIALTPNARRDRAEAVKQLQTLDLQSYAISDMDIKLNTDTFVVSYNLTLRGTSGGQPLPGAPRRVLGVWQKQKAGWMLLAHSILSGPS